MPDHASSAAQPAVVAASAAGETSPPEMASGAAAAENKLQVVDFRAPAPLDAGAQRQLRLRHDEWARSLSTRLSIYLRLECQVTVASLETVRCRSWLDRLNSPTHLTLFALEGKTGSGVLEVSPKLGLIIVDRLLGGAGEPENVTRLLTEIEMAVTDEVNQILLREWCQYLPVPEPIRLTITGHETNSRFVQATADEAPILGVTLQLTLKGQTERVQLGIPLPMLEPALTELVAMTVPVERSVPATSAALVWNPQLDQVRIPLTARCQDFEISARRLAGLQVGDVLPIEPVFLNHIQVRLAKVPKFLGRLGRKGTHRAVELTAFIPK